jgi:heat shock protein HslJ
MTSRGSGMFRFSFTRVALAVALIGAATALLLPGLPGFWTLSAQQDARRTGAWLDRPLVNWNRKLGQLPTPLSPLEREEIEKRCPNLLRQEDSPYEREIVGSGWLLYGAVQSYGLTRVITAMSGADDLCRPLGHQAFVYFGSTYAGTLSPVAMDPLTNGDLSTIRLVSANSISAEFARYREKDPPCCPTRMSYLTYEVSGDDAPLVSPVERVTKPLPSQDTGPSESPSPEVARLFEVKWRLTEIRGVAVRTNNPYITFGRAAKIFSGNGGCNQIVGRFEVDGTSLTFSHLVGTRLACPDSDAQQIETDFIKVLEQTTTFRLQDDVLRLYDLDSLMLVFQPIDR